MFILSSLVILVAALVVIAVAVMLAETTLVYVALGLGGISAVLLAVECVRYLRYTAELPRGGTAERKAGMVEASRTGGLGKASVPVPARTGVPAHHSRGTGAYPAPAGGPARDTVFPRPHVHWEVPPRQGGTEDGPDPADRDSGADTSAGIASPAALGEPAPAPTPERSAPSEPSAAAAGDDTAEGAAPQEPTVPGPHGGPHAHAGDGSGETTSLNLGAVGPDDDPASDDTRPEYPAGEAQDEATMVPVEGAPAAEHDPRVDRAVADDAAGEPHTGAEDENDGPVAEDAGERLDHAPDGPVAEDDTAPTSSDSPEESPVAVPDPPHAGEPEPAHAEPVAAEEPDGLASLKTGPGDPDNPGDPDTIAGPADGVDAELPEPEDLPDIDQLPRVGDHPDDSEDALSFGAFVERLQDDDTPTDAEAGAEEDATAEHTVGEEPPTGPIPRLAGDPEPVDADVEPDPDTTDVFTRPNHTE